MQRYLKLTFDSLTLWESAFHTLTAANVGTEGEDQLESYNENEEQVPVMYFLCASEYVEKGLQVSLTRYLSNNLPQFETFFQ